MSLRPRAAVATAVVTALLATASASFASNPGPGTIQNGINNTMQNVYNNVNNATNTAMNTAGAAIASGSNTANQAGCNRGSVLVQGTSYLGGRGVNVYENCNNRSAETWNTWGWQWECVELAQRLWNQKEGYPAQTFSGVKTAYQIYDKFRNHTLGDGTAYPNDLSYTPEP